MSKQAGILVLVLFAAGIITSCGSSTPAGPGNATPTPSPTASGDVTIRVTGINGGMSFSPTTVTVKVGQTVTWQNTDSITHRMLDNGGSFDSGTLSGGATSTPVKLTTVGAFPYHCTIHPSMTGTITVTP